MTRRAAIFGLACAVAAGIACGPAIDLSQSLAVTDMFSGWYDAGVKDNLNHLVPSVTFRLKNIGAADVNEVQLLVSFWGEGADGETASKDVTGIGDASLKPGGVTDPILVRSDVGYTSEAARADFFTNSQFKDFIAKVFAKRGGKFFKLGEFKIDRRIIPQLSPAVPRP